MKYKTFQANNQNTSCNKKIWFFEVNFWVNEIFLSFNKIHFDFNWMYWLFFKVYVNWINWWLSGTWFFSAKYIRLNETIFEWKIYRILWRQWISCNLYNFIHLMNLWMTQKSMKPRCLFWNSLRNSHLWTSESAWATV